MKLLFGIVGGLLALAGNVPYVRDVLRKKIQPHPYTWLVWSIVSGVTFVGQVVKGAGFATIAFAVSEIFTILIFILSLKYGFKNIPKNDSYFLMAALLGILPWIILKDPTWSVVIMVSIDLIAFVPTLKKAWYLPTSESPLLYGSNVARHGFALLALSSYNLATMLHSVAMMITNTVMTIFIKRKSLININSIMKTRAKKTNKTKKIEPCDYCKNIAVMGVGSTPVGRGSDESLYDKTIETQCSQCQRPLSYYY